MIRLAGIFIAFALITLAVTYPVVTHFDSHIPQGFEPAATVPLFNAWTLWWNLDRAAAGLEDYWNAPIFYPTEGTFAYSEPQPILMCLAPLDSVLTLAGLYNLYLVLSLWLNGLLGYALFRGLNFTRAVAFCGGMLTETLPFTHWQLGILQLVPVWGVLWVILSLVKIGGSRSYWWSASLGTALAMTYWCCNYYGVFLVVLSAPAGLILVQDRLREGRFWKQVALAALWFALFAGPLIRGQLKYINDAGFERNAARVAELSAVPEDYVLFPFESRLNPIHLQQTDEPQRWALSAGLCSYLLALAGFVFYVCTDRYRAWALFSLVFCVAAYLLSLGPALDEFGVPLYRVLRTAIPGYSKIRALHRFAVFFQLGCAFLGTLCLQLAVETISNRRSRRLQATLLVAMALFFGATIAERWPAPPRVTPVPWNESEPEWCRFVREQTPPDAALVCFPFPADKQASDYEQQTHWMLSIPWHHRPIVNGYSGFLPDSFFQIRSATLGGLDYDCLKLLRETGVQYCIVNASWIEDSPLTLEDFADNPGLKRVFADSAKGISVYEVLSEDLVR